MTRRKCKIQLGWELEIDDLDSLKLIENSGFFENVEVHACQNLIKSGDRVLDIGANIGYYTKLFAHLVGVEGKVIGFEPNPENYQLLNINLRDEANKNIVSLHQMALGNEVGNCDLFLSEENNGKHRLYESVLCSKNSISVDVIPGDEIVDAPVNFIKIDVEGFEYQAIKGLKSVIQASPKLKILMEFAPLSMMESGIKVEEFFLDVLNGMDLKCLAFVRGSWTLITNKVLLTQVKKLNQIELKDLRQCMSGHSDSAIERLASETLKKINYERPLIESLLLVKTTIIEDALAQLNSKSKTSTFRFWSDLAERIKVNDTVDIPPDIEDDPTTTCISDYLGFKKKAGSWFRFQKHSLVYESISPVLENGFLGLWEEVFSSTTTYKKISWKYQNNGVGIGAFENNDLSGFIGGCSRTVFWGDDIIQTVQLTDVMTAKKFRSLYRTNGIFFRMASLFLDSKVGYGKEFLLGFGFPSNRAFRLAKTLGLYEKVDSMVQLTWKVKSNPSSYILTTQEFNNDLSQVLEELWLEMLDSLGDSIVGDRSIDFLYHRYRDHPENIYKFVLIKNRITRKFISLAILRDCDEEGLEVVDIIGGAQNFSITIKALIRFTFKLSRNNLFLWITNSHKKYFEIGKFEIKDLSISVPCNTWSPGPSADQLKNKWFLMSGDTDFR